MRFYSAPNRSACQTFDDAHETIRRMLKVLHLEATRRNLSYWLDGGSLLGATRTGGVIPWDVDGDVGIDQASGDLLRKEPLAVTDDFLFELTPDRLWLPMRLIDKASGLYIDFFEFVPLFVDVTTNETIYACRPGMPWYKCAKCIEMHDNGRMPVMRRSVLLPTRPCTLDNLPMRCPNKIDEYLEYEYGEGWRQPVYPKYE
jgi:hypothetical protein